MKNPLFYTIILIIGLNWQCKIGQAIIHSDIPTQKDYKIFPSRFIAKSDNTFRFYEAKSDLDLGHKIMVDSRRLNPASVSLETMLDDHKTLSFLIIRNDTILYEKYFEEYNKASVVESFSVSKAFVSTLLGAAIKDGFVKNEDEPITNYIPELALKPGFDKICIRHLLNHTSGIRFTTNSSPTSDNAQFYWGRNLREKMFKLDVKEPAGTSFDYSSENTALLGLVIERATHKSLSQNLEEKIWKPLGMEYDATWSTDEASEKAIEKAFCCINGRAIDFAKLGRLYLRNGNWNGHQILPENWVNEVNQQSTNEGGRLSYHYNFGIGPKAYGSYYAAGLYGQFVYIYPQKNIIIVRFGETDLAYNPPFWHEIVLEIIDQLVQK